ncbi:hypothetical protein V497_05357 [Pseudogymnoascus sp. VKM F-4516 (FW-969)]|nr:hypothetical protein V497_05357 [Pseudogymnoascus sp. VKM F-4516 (FW-969)]
MAAPSEPPTSGNYPIFLSPALLNQGLGTKDLITAIKYSQPPSTPATSALLKPSTSDQHKYNLTMSSPSSTSFYHGARSSGAPKKAARYVLVWDATRGGWELRPVDSVFDMGFVRSAAAEGEGGGAVQDESPVKAAPKGRRKSLVAPKEEVKRQKTVGRGRRESVSDESESDDGLTIEYPGGRAPKRPFGLGLGTPLGGREERGIGRVDMDVDMDADADADADEDGDGDGDVEVLDLGSPAQGGVEEEESDEEREEEVDLEAELERELAKGGGESSESEEE